MLTAIAALHNLDIHQIDIKIEFLNDELNEKYIWSNMKDL